MTNNYNQTHYINSLRFSHGKKMSLKHNEGYHLSMYGTCKVLLNATVHQKHHAICHILFRSRYDLFLCSAIYITDIGT